MTDEERKQIHEKRMSALKPFREIGYKDRWLLIRDICGRLPWGVFAYAMGNNAKEGQIYEVDELDFTHMGNEKVMCSIPGEESHIKYGFDVGQIRPLLRPMEDMNKEEKEEYHRILALDMLLEKSSPDVLMDFFHSKGFDCRGLIKKGLAYLD